LRLPADADALDAMAVAYEKAQDAVRMLHFWKETAKRLEKTLETATAQLQSLLADRIIGSTENLDEALAEYQHACAERYQLAALASRKRDLEMQLAAKIEAETSAAEINQQRKSAEAELSAAAGICGVTGDNDAEIVKRLQEWLKECERKKLLQDELRQNAFVRLAWNERQLEQRELLFKSNLPLNAAAAKSRLQREDGQQELGTGAEHCGVGLGPEEQLAEDLHHWLNATTEEIRVEQQGIEKWRELDTLLERRTLQEFQAKVQDHRE